MDRETKLRGLMGLCVRARQATFGEDGCLKSIRGGGCAVLLLDSGASKATQDKYRGVCDNAGVQMALLPRGLLQDATGRSGVAMAVAPGGLAEQIRQNLPVEGKEEHGQQMKSENHKGYSLEESIHRAKEYISGALEAMLDLGKGSGPMDHGFEMRGKFSI